MTTQAPPSRGFTALLFATSGAYAADQLTLAAQPLAAVLLMGASAREVGLLVAVHSAAWLIVSMPAGMLVDRLGRRRIASATQALAAAALALATVAAMKGWPIGIGALTTMVALRWIAPDPPMHAATTREPILAAMRAGAAFVRDEPLLRAIALCAICWNFAYFALVAVFVPFALERVGLHAGTVGLVQSIFGVGSIAAALLAAPLFARIAPRCFLVAGPASSVLAASLLLVSARTGDAILPALTYLLLGFAPMLWFICQTTLRQTITPRALLGRVSATIQVAIYGVRPLGALAGGALADFAGLDAALMLVITAFAASTLVAWLSPLGRLRAMPDAV